MAFNFSRRSKRLNHLRATYSDRLQKSHDLRLMIAGGFFLGLVAATIWPFLKIEAPLILVFVVWFTYLVVRTRRLSQFVIVLERLELFYERQYLRICGDAAPRDWESALKEFSSSLVSDLALIGPHSVFTLLDETLTDGGRALLLKRILDPDRSKILGRQKLIYDVRGLRWFATRFTLAGQAQDLRLATHQVLTSVSQSFVEKPAGPVLALAILVWLGASANLIFLHLISPTAGWAIFVASNFLLKRRVGAVFKKGEGLSVHLGGLAPLFQALEKQAVLRGQVPEIQNTKPSVELRALNRILAFLSTEANPLVELLVNFFSPWTLTATYFLERKRLRLSATLPQCFEELWHFEDLACDIFFYNFQTQTFPVIEDKPVLRFTDLVHPLIKRSKVVSNSFHFQNGKTLGLITGSNMSGKSTFLRTIGVNQVLANMGLPVFAREFRTYPFELESCIQVSDSLRDGYSYFYAEVLRLKAILERVEAGHQVLFLIDEIFRGTNNRERQIGSRSMIEALLGHKCLGFISTHDLELTELEKKYPALENLHFREEIRAGEMFFTYRLQLGPCPTTNALLIMKKVGLPVTD